MEREPVRVSVHEAANSPESENDHLDAIYVFGSYPFPQEALRLSLREILSGLKEHRSGLIERVILGRNITTVSWENLQKTRNWRAEVKESLKSKGIETEEVNYKYPSKRIYELRNRIRKKIGRRRAFHPSGLMYDTRLKVWGAYFMRKKTRTSEGKLPPIYTMLKIIRDWQRKSYAQLEEDMIKKHDPDTEVIKEEVSDDLLTKVQQAKRISEEMGFARIAIMVDGEHKKRTQDLINYVETPEDRYPSYELVTWEEILPDPEYTGRRAPAFARIKDNLYDSPYWKLWQLREGLVRKLPPKFVSKASHRTR
ncbi:MAG: hypothetical protein M1365_01510 [Actinobacteria bacterium]|nr:hypothetical protein [Actinomycetota bacterium]